MNSAEVEALANMTDEQRAQLYKNTFSTTSGLQCLQDIKYRAFREASAALTMDGHFISEPHAVYFNLGMQRLCFHIESQINYQQPPPEVRLYED